MGDAAPASPSPLAALLRDRIARDGPVSVAEFMAVALTHPQYGYYVRRRPLGRGGDFTTAPEVSQVFGELVGLWCLVVWQGMGRPDPVVLSELGPGRGTLMADALRACRGAEPAFLEAARLHPVEVSPALRAVQRTAIAGTCPGLAAVWHDDFASVPDGPLLLIANEFFDALPVRQLVRTEAGWCERCVGLATPSGGEPRRFAFIDVALDEPPVLPPGLAEAAPGCIVEVRPAGDALVRAIARRLRQYGGAALIIDYGHADSAPGDTLQAVRRHAYHPVLDRPGEADLTAHVDFATLAAAAREAGAMVFGPLPQGVFLGRLGAAERTRALQAHADPEQAALLGTGFRRLTHPREMGLLFKVLALSDPGGPVPPGFDLPVR
ncbi:MAG: class I SAM-dependent methyltransferase [Rhodospirillales bacterium]|nr:MAG: class I SAM-dependent methyltransferase [Rhodospirillales bacterium]